MTDHRLAEEFCDRCGNHPAAVRREFAYVCVGCAEYLARSHSGFLVGGDLRAQRRAEYLIARLEREMLDEALGAA